MRKLAIIITLVALASFALWWAATSLRRQGGLPVDTARREQGSQPPTAESSQGMEASLTNSREIHASRSLNQAERAKLSRKELLRFLEDLGEVPSDADISEYQLAQEASWWGKPLDPKRFWKDRVVWVDAATASAARRHGRQFPPLPYDDPAFAGYPDVDHHGGAEVEGPGLEFHTSSKENAFWNEFAKTHPRPPESLEREQVQLEGSRLKMQYVLANNASGSVKAEDVDSVKSSELGNAYVLGYPEESLSDKAIFASYVIAKRRAYQQFRDAGASEDDVRIKVLFDFSFLDRNLIIGPLPEQIAYDDNAWKIAYLQRLRRKETDESYIYAYLQAWNLSADAVFSGTNGP